MKAFLDRPQSVLARRVLFQVHLWVGVLAGLYIFLVCVTGAALVFRIDMQRAIYPDLFTPQVPGPPVNAVDVMETVAREYPGERVSGVDAPTTARPTYLAYAGSGNRFRTLLLDPVSAELLGELSDQSFLRTLQDLHFDLLAGRTGRLVNGIGAIVMLAMSATGLVVWWPGRSRWRRAFSVDFRRQWKRVTWDLHSAVGIWTVLLVMMWAVTGIYFAFPGAFRAAVNRVSSLTVTRAPQSDPAPAGQAAAPTWRTLIESARRHAPGLHVARVVVPANASAAFLVMFSSVRPTPVGAELTPVYLDQYTGELLPQSATAGRTSGDIVMAWVVPLHVGSFGGLGVRIAWLVLGLSPPLLFVTGFIMWWTRVVRSRWLGVSQPAAEGYRAAPRR
ncbi:MAG: PepSY-associated TM helix domain-containing protein [Acidobacteriota bacterium]